MNEQKETILVTGSSGSIGYPVAQRLAETFNVVGFDRKAPSHPPPSADCLYVDLTSEKSVQRGLAAIRQLHGNHLAAVVHLAAYYDFLTPTNPLYDEITVQGTARLLRLLQDFEVEQFIFSSTELVHAPSKPGQRLNEESPVKPSWGYPKSKINTEQVLRTQRGKIPVVMLRIAGVYDDLCNSIPLAHQMQRVYERDITAYLFPGDPSQGRQAYVHNDDVVDAILRAVDRRRTLPPEVALLIGEPESPSFEELQGDFGRLIHGEAAKITRVPRWFARVGAVMQERLFGRPSFVKPWMVEFATDNLELDISRARATIGWEPKHRLLATLPLMAAALLADPAAFYRENELTPPLWLQAATPPPAPAIPAEMDRHQAMQMAEQLVGEITGQHESATPAPMNNHADHAAHGSNRSMDMPARQPKEPGAMPDMKMPKPQVNKPAGAMPDMDMPDMKPGMEMKENG